MFALKIFPRSDFFQLLLQLDNDQLMSEKQKNCGVTVLASEIKRVGNVFLEALVHGNAKSAFLLQGIK